jgi:hypothetical protein
MLKLARSRSVALLLLIGCTAALGGCVPSGPVTPSAPFSHWVFEGYGIVSYLPDTPVALAYLFHGAGGSANFAEQVETVDVLNELIGRGYGFVATESTNRNDKRWDRDNPSLSSNPDLARLGRLHQHLIDSTGVEPTTPIVGLGHSNGGRFVTLWGQTWANAGYPVRGVGAYNGSVAPSLNPANLTVPHFFVTAQNDSPTPMISDFFTAWAAGVPVELHVAEERNLVAARFARIPGIDAAEAQEIFNYLVIQFIWNPEGQRIVSVDEAFSRSSTAVLPPSVEGQRADIVRECHIALAGHPLRADYKVDMANFFGQHL